MSLAYQANPDANTTAAIPIDAVTADSFDDYREACDEASQQWFASHAFTAKAGSHLVCPGADGTIARVVVGVTDDADIASLGGLPLSLPEGIYAIGRHPWDIQNLELALLGWALGSYRYTRFKEADRGSAVLQIPAQSDGRRLQAFEQATNLVRSLVNDPAGDMLPSHLSHAAQQLADEFDASFQEIVGDDLLEQNFPVIHAVGRASTDEPRLIELNWGRDADPAVTLVGKGVCFDSGGLNIKPGGSMRWMKKDMGGAAHVLGLARLIMQLALPIRLRVLVPAVENAIAGNAYRPGDILIGRNGKTIEIDNTDAEGRLVLSDALTLAAEAKPELVVDYATLTGAARVALGTELPAMFATAVEVTRGIQDAGEAIDDLVWPMPLHTPYRKLIDSNVADIVNSGPGFGGAITAALFLQDFVGEHDWVHFDVMAFNNRSRAGRPEGGEAMGMRAVFAYLEARFAG
ncbi:MAG: leucyl aminopeptidase family protein [Pseudomonadaceae bacterium]|nr:leucyl aminopeptidase family protein [Pseudomonadaceae bacterium]